MKLKTRKKRIVRRKRRVVRRNPGVKQGFALIRGGGPTGMKMVVVSTHKTREGAETAMIKKGGTPESLFTKGYSIFAFGPGTRYEYLDSEFTGKFLRPIVGNRSLRKNEGLGYTSYIPESGFLVAKTTGYHDTPSGKFQLLKKGQVLRILFTTKERRGGGTTGKEYFVAETTDHPYEGMKVLVEKGYAGKIYNSDPRKSSSRYGNRLMGNPMRSFASLHPSDRAKLNRFSDYVNSFYGKGGVYARDFKNGGFDRKTIERAIMVYIDDVRKGKVEWGDGDSIDRERVRMILQPSYSMSIPKGATILRPNRRMGLRGNPRLGKYEQKALNFARKYPGWHGFDPRKPTANIVRKLARKGLVKVSNISNQFRAI